MLCHIIEVIYVLIKIKDLRYFLDVVSHVHCIYCNCCLLSGVTYVLFHMFTMVFHVFFMFTILII